VHSVTRPPGTDAPVGGRLAIVTGASAGIGREAARGLARAGARVLLACRDAGRGEAAAADIRSTVPGASVEVGLVDLARPAAIRGFAARLRARGEPVAALVNNAGLWSSTRQATPDGLELTWATNVLGYHLLTEELLPLLTPAPSHVIHVASRLAGQLDLEDVQFDRRPYRGLAAYAQSKQADRMLAWELARRLQGTPVTVSAMHPGGVRTAIFRKGGGLQGRLAEVLGWLAGRSPAKGADTIVWLCTDAAAGRSGRFWIDRREVACEFRDPRAEDALVALCRKQVGSGLASRLAEARPSGDA
jgi:NAD(P)-dependent dehydrogenase (short-subunit alcohol dehydrogenase family)